MREGDGPTATHSMAAYSDLKRVALGALTGRVLEIGAGRGANFGYLRCAVDWICLEPNVARHPDLRASAARHGRAVTILSAPAERIPLPDASVDAVVGTVVLCSVADQAAVLAEILRVLRPGAPYLFFEHVASPTGTLSYRLQRLAAPFTRRFDGGCDPTRQTWRAIEAAGFAGVDLRWFGGGNPLRTFGRYIAGSATAGTN
jgi:ubiquinone/menaquinone biosynthesis C-methylase UbiE